MKYTSTVVASVHIHELSLVKQFKDFQNYFHQKKITPALYPFDINSVILYLRNKDSRIPEVFQSTLLPVHTYLCIPSAQGLLVDCLVNANRNNAILSRTLNI